MSGRPGALAAVIAVLAAGLLLPAAARADRLLLDAETATELAEGLKGARERTGVCFTWNVLVNALDGSPGGQDAGSDAGPDLAPTGDCARAATLSATVTYTSESSEAEDSSGIALETTGLPALSEQDLTDLAGSDAGDLLGDDDDKALFNLVNALPLLVAGADPAIAGKLAAPETGGAPSDAAPDGGGGSDFLRNHGLTLGFAILLLLAALWLARPMRSRSTTSPHPTAATPAEAP